MWPRIHIPPLFRPAGHICCHCGSVHAPGAGNSLDSKLATTATKDNDCRHLDCGGCLQANSCGHILQKSEAEGPHSWDCGACGATAVSVLEILTDTITCCDFPSVAAVHDHMGQALLGEAAAGAGSRELARLQDLLEMQHWLYMCGAWIYLEDVEKIVRESRAQASDDIIQAQDGQAALAGKDKGCLRGVDEIMMLNTQSNNHALISGNARVAVNRKGKQGEAGIYHPDNDEDDRNSEIDGDHCEPGGEEEPAAPRKKVRKRKKRTQRKKNGTDGTGHGTTPDIASSPIASTPATNPGQTTSVNSTPLGLRTPTTRDSYNTRHWSMDDRKKTRSEILGIVQDENTPLRANGVHHFDRFDVPGRNVQVSMEPPQPRKRKNDDMGHGEDAMGITASLGSSDQPDVGRPRKRVRKRRSTNANRNNDPVGSTTAVQFGVADDDRYGNYHNRKGGTHHDYIGQFSNDPRDGDRKAFNNNNNNNNNNNDRNGNGKILAGSSGLDVYRDNHWENNGGGGGACKNGTNHRTNIQTPTPLRNHGEDNRMSNANHGGPDNQQPLTSPSVGNQAGTGKKRKRRSRAKGAAAAGTANNNGGDSNSGIADIHHGRENWRPVSSSVKIQDNHHSKIDEVNDDHSGNGSNNRDGSSNAYGRRNKRGKAKKCDSYIPPPPPPPLHHLSESQRKTNVNLGSNTDYGHRYRLYGTPPANNGRVARGRPKRKSTEPLEDDAGRWAKRTARDPWSSSWNERRQQ